MRIAEAARGLGVGCQILRELEASPVRTGFTVRLETNHVLVEALALYESAGYSPVEAFNDEPVADLWFTRTLAHEER